MLRTVMRARWVVMLSFLLVFINLQQKVLRDLLHVPPCCVSCTHRLTVYSLALISGEGCMTITPLVVCASTAGNRGGARMMPIRHLRAQSEEEVVIRGVLQTTHLASRGTAMALIHNSARNKATAATPGRGIFNYLSREDVTAMLERAPAVSEAFLYYTAPDAPDCGA
jgi:hypothetical protein